MLKLGVGGLRNPGTKCIQCDVFSPKNWTNVWRAKCHVEDNAQALHSIQNSGCHAIIEGDILGQRGSCDTQQGLRLSGLDHRSRAQ